ncbi:hypothetical protein IAR55_002831 [Kwoniella newhampshirensis]|uniref:RNase H type-1 domain-containing protein n=1 Tax=Kwoniella newhampshirensis TaxID=1651941 RepID=A0AAW0Z038_9TREE
MTKLSNSISYRLLRQWDQFCRLLPQIKRYEIWSDASGRGYGGHLGPQHRPLDVWQATHSGLNSVVPSSSSGISSSSSELTSTVGDDAGGGPNGSTEYVEAMAVLLSLRRWSDQLRGKKVYCYIDNYTVYKYLSRRYSNSIIPSRHRLFPQNFFGSSTKSSHHNSSFLSTATTTTTTAMTPTTTTTTITTLTTTSGTGKTTVAGKERPMPKKVKFQGTRETLEQIERLVEEHDIILRARWVWGKDNRLADRLSRLGRGYAGLPPEVRELLKASGGAVQARSGGEGQDRPPTTMA